MNTIDNILWLFLAHCITVFLIVAVCLGALSSAYKRGMPSIDTETPAELLNASDDRLTGVDK